MVSFRRFVSVALVAVVALTITFPSAAARADEPWRRPSPPSAVTVTVLPATALEVLQTKALI